jgi:hypothetical protein
MFPFPPRPANLPHTHTFSRALQNIPAGVDIHCSPTLLVEGVEFVGKGACSTLATLTALIKLFNIFPGKPVVTPLVKKSSAFIKPEVCILFFAKAPHHWRVSQARVHQEAELDLLPTSWWFPSWLNLESWRWRRKTLADFQWTTRRYIPEDKSLHNHSCENLKSYLPQCHFVIHKTSQRLNPCLRGEMLATNRLSYGPGVKHAQSVSYTRHHR